MSSYHFKWLSSTEGAGKITNMIQSEVLCACQETSEILIQLFFFTEATFWEIHSL